MSKATITTAVAYGMTTITTANGTKKLAVLVTKAGERITARPVAGLVRGKEVTVVSNVVPAKAAGQKEAVFWEIMEDFDAPVTAPSAAPETDVIP